MDVHLSDFITIGLLVVLEGLLSADNALVLAILVLGLPRHQQRKALRYGILGAFAFRILATLLAVHLLAVAWIKLIGALYLLYLSYAHFFGRHENGERTAIKPAQAAFGLSAFWATVVKVELTDIVFAVDSILVAVAMSNKMWVIITGGVLGIITMRMVIGQLLAIQAFFSYRNVDPTNIRNIAAYGGGAVMDIGCYPINVARWLFGAEPDEVRAVVRRDPDFGTDVLTSAVLEFAGRQATFTCSTQIEDHQRVDLVGTAGRLVVEIPFNIPPDRATRLLRIAGGDPPVAPATEVIEVPAADPYGVLDELE